MTPPASCSGIFPLADELIALRNFAQNPRNRHRPAHAAAASVLSGSHAGNTRGRGLDFAELRAYQAGDDVRNIDWRRAARHGQPCTKVFQEERDRTLRLLVDLGPSMQFGTRVAFKSVAAARGAALLAWAATAAGDRVGAMVWHGGGWAEALPRARRAGALELIRLLSTRPQGSMHTPAAFAEGLQRLARRLRCSDQVAIFSDFRQIDAASETSLIQIGQRAACRLVHVHDPFEAAAPPPGVYALTDGSREIVLDFADEAVRHRHAKAFAAHCERLSRLALRAGARLLPLSTDTAQTDLVAALS